MACRHDHEEAGGDGGAGDGHDHSHGHGHDHSHDHEDPDGMSLFGLIDTTRYDYCWYDRAIFPSATRCLVYIAA